MTRRCARLRNDLHLSDIERDEIRQVLLDIRARGYAFGVHLTTPHAWSIASPIFDRAGVVTAVLVVSGPDIRIDDQIAQRHGAQSFAAREGAMQRLGVPTLSRAAEARGSTVMP